MKLPVLLTDWRSFLPTWLWDLLMSRLGWDPAWLSDEIEEEVNNEAPQRTPG